MSRTCEASRMIPLFLTAILLLGFAPLDFTQNEVTASLGDVDEANKVGVSKESYDLFLDEANAENGGDGSITTAEPSNGHKEESALSGLEFRSAEMISDLQIYGQGSSHSVQLSVYLQFQGSEGSTADVTFSLESGESDIGTETVSLSDPCTGGLLGSSCSWTPNEVFFEVSENGFTVPSGKQLKVRIDAQATCESQTGGIGGGNDCDVLIAFGDVESTNGFSRLELDANALSDSSVRVHEVGQSWNDEETVEWAPNHLPQHRTMQFSIDVRDSFGRDDIQSVSLVMSTPSGANTVFDKSFDDDELKLDNNGLVGNYTWTYDPGIASGEYPLALEIRDVQGHTVYFEHQGITFVEHDIFLSLPSHQPDTVLIAPGKDSTVEFSVDHIGATDSPIKVVFDLARSLPASWSAPIWDQPGGYTLSGGGAYAHPQLQISVPDGDLSNAPDYLEVEARAYATNDQGQEVEVAIRDITLSIEEVGVFAPPRVSVFEDFEHQLQIADSERPDAYDDSLSHYVDASDVGDFYIDVFNSGFDTDVFKIRVEEMPESWQFKFIDNNTGAELLEEGIYSLTPEIGSHQVSGVVMEVYPPTDRDAVDIGQFEISITSKGESELTSSVTFTVHRTFGVLVEVIADSDSGDLGQVGPVNPGSSVWYNMRITDSSDNGGTQTTWRIVNPASLERNLENNAKYSSWGYEISNGSNSDIVVVHLAPDEYADLTLDIELRDQVEAGNHTIYVRVIEEGVDSADARYFDLPVTIEVAEDIKQGRLEMVQKSENTRFSPGEIKNLDFMISNNNNVPLDVVITLSEPTGWDGSVKASSDQMGGPFVILQLDPYSSKDFTVQLEAPETLKNSQTILFSLTATPMNEEVPHDEYTQKANFEFKTECSDFSCILNEIKDPEMSTVLLGIGILVLAGVAINTRAKNRANTEWQGNFYEEEEVEVEVNKEFDLDIPEPVQEVVPEDDDLELLDELEDI